MTPRFRFARMCAATLLCWAGAAQAGPYADDLAKCLVSSTTAEDKHALIRWIFANAVLHPQVRELASLSVAQRTDVNTQTGRLMERLLTDVCKPQLQTAIRYEGPGTIETGFAILGQVAMRELMTDQSVARGFSEVELYVDKEKMRRAFGAPAR
ncbi:MAG TPA: hypothetical protein VG873_17430 [Burkholderiales bacterium]|nr:hypothetical protein [Burkholderiales bacterium]